MTYDKGKKHNTPVATLIKIYVSKSFDYISNALIILTGRIRRKSYPLSLTQIGWTGDGHTLKCLTIGTSRLSPR